MIPVHCFTNLDEWKQATWPKHVACPPRVGEQMRGILGDRKPILRIAMITHCDDGNGPYLRVELHR